MLCVVFNCVFFVDLEIFDKTGEASYFLMQCKYQEDILIIIWTYGRGIQEITLSLSSNTRSNHF